MFPSKIFAGAVLGAAWLFSHPARADEAPTDDDTFLLLREAARQDDVAKSNALSSRLPAYAIASYVDYYRLKPRLKDATDTEVLDFLKRYEGSAIADRLRNDWLLELGKRRDWAQFDRELPLYVINDDTQVKCYGLLSRALKGRKVADEARALLVNPPMYGEACAALIAPFFLAILLFFSIVLRDDGFL
ncbi:MAG: lytic transglycosylase domain-containing protein, partial [Pseudomonadota bacterium]